MPQFGGHYLATNIMFNEGTLAVDVAACQAVRIAPKTLRSVVYNLLSNAVKYRAPTRLPQVQLRGHVMLEVQDNGLGLSAAQQGQLFGMFRRLHTHVEGSGVGLFMVKRLIENAGGLRSGWRRWILPSLTLGNAPPLPKPLRGLPISSGH